MIVNKFEVAQIARAFAAKALRGQSMPAAPIEQGLIAADDLRAHEWFLNELRHIANRIDNRRKAEGNQRQRDPGQRRPNRRERAAIALGQEQ